MSSSIQRRIGRGERRNERESQEEGEYEEQDQEEEQEQGRGKIPTQGLETLPQRIEHDTRVRALCEIFFVHVHPLRCLSFIHKPSFMQSLDLGRVLVDFGEALVFIVCAFGERSVVEVLDEDTDYTDSFCVCSDSRRYFRQGHDFSLPLPGRIGQRGRRNLHCRT